MKKCYLCRFSRWIIDGSIVWMANGATYFRLIGYKYGYNKKPVIYAGCEDVEAAETMRCAHHGIQVASFETCAEFMAYVPIDRTGRYRADHRRTADRRDRCKYRYSAKFSRPSKNKNKRTVMLTDEVITQRKAVEAL